MELRITYVNIERHFEATIIQKLDASDKTKTVR